MCHLACTFKREHQLSRKKSLAPSIQGEKKLQKKNYCVLTWDRTYYLEQGFHQLGYREGVDWTAHACVLYVC